VCEKAPAPRNAAKSAETPPEVPPPVRRDSPAPAPVLAGDPIAASRRLVKKQQPEAAAQALEAEISRDPGDPDLYAELGLLYLRQLGKRDEGIQHLERSLDLDVNQPEVLPALVAAYRTPDHIEDGLRYLRELADLKHPGAAGAALAYADLRAGKGESREAAGYLESKAASLDAPADAYLMAANLNMGSRRFDQAARDFQRAIDYSRQQGGSAALQARAIQAAEAGLDQARKAQRQAEEQRRS
jgi:tetratricopeptide (TPR) repeat protein